MSRQTKLIFAVLALLTVTFALLTVVIKQRRTIKPIPPSRLIFIDTDLYQKMEENLNSNNIRSFEIDVESEIVIIMELWTTKNELLAEGFSEVQANEIFSYIDSKYSFFIDENALIVWLKEGKVVHYSTLPSKFLPSTPVEHVYPGGKLRVWKPENQERRWRLTSLKE